MTLTAISGHQALLARLCGDLGKSEAAARRGLQYAKEGLGSAFQMMPLLNHAWVLAAQNRGEELLQVVDALDVPFSIEKGITYAVQIFRAQGLFSCGRVEEARAQVEEAGALAEALFGDMEICGPESLYGFILTVGVSRRILGAEGQAQCEGIIAQLKGLIDLTGLVILQPELDLERAGARAHCRRRRDVESAAARCPAGLRGRRAEAARGRDRGCPRQLTP